MPVASDRSPEVVLPPFSGLVLDRAMTVRQDPASVSRMLVGTVGRAVAAGPDGVLLGDGDEPTLVRTSLASAAACGVDATEPILLGIENNVPLFAVDLGELDPSARASYTRAGAVVGLREAAGMLARAESALAAYLVAILNWHRGHRHCANCGTRTAVTEAGYSKRCPGCGAQHFPRTDPVVIMLVEHAGRLLLGRRATRPEREYSVLAGFVSPGESLEEAVVREVREESGIEAYAPTFVASQPWPFPSSLMLGFEARSDGGDPITVDGELEDVRWFTLDAVRAAVTGSSVELRLPPRFSIARYLIDRWAAAQSPAG